jgi:hypothetical protein
VVEEVENFFIHTQSVSGGEKRERERERERENERGKRGDQASGG